MTAPKRSGEFHKRWKAKRKGSTYILLYTVYCIGRGKVEGAHRGQWDFEALVEELFGRSGGWSTETLTKGFRPIDRDNSSPDRNNPDGQDMQVLIVCLGQSRREGRRNFNRPISCNQRRHNITIITIRCGGGGSRRSLGAVGIGPSSPGHPTKRKGRCIGMYR